MFPIGDDNSGERTFPLVTYALIALNVLFFFVELNGGDAFVKQWAFVPSRFLANPSADFPTLFTSMFMHGGWVHLGGNMLYLWIFGDNVEDRLGHGTFTVFYFVCGLAATFAQLMFNAGSHVPNLGASGAIAGVLGAYLVMFPRRRVYSLVPIVFIFTLLPLPAIVVLGFWFVLQFFSGVTTVANHVNGGVAYFAHIGGFAVGLILALLFFPKERLRDRRDEGLIS
jgi:membrane associated rhomboid family serine protease